MMEHVALRRARKRRLQVLGVSDDEFENPWIGPAQKYPIPLITGGGSAMRLEGRAPENSDLFFFWCATVVLPHFYFGLFALETM